MRTRQIADSDSDAQNPEASHHDLPQSGLCRTRLPVLHRPRSAPRIEACPMQAVPKIVIERDTLKWPWKFLPPSVSFVEVFRLPTLQPAKIPTGSKQLSNMCAGSATSKDSVVTKSIA